MQREGGLLLRVRRRIQALHPEARAELALVERGLEVHLEREACRLVVEHALVGHAHDPDAVTLALGGGVVPPGVRVVEFEDGPYQKYEELHGGRAHVTGDAAFDAKFLVYGERDAVQSVDPRVRGFLLERVVEGLSFTKDELRLYLPLGPDEAAAALEAALALAEELDALGAS